MSVIYILANNGNGPAYRLCGDPAGTFSLWDGSTDHPQGEGIKRNWNVVPASHPLILEVKDELDNRPDAGRELPDIDDPGDQEGDDLKDKLSPR